MERISKFEKILENLKIKLYIIYFRINTQKNLFRNK